MPPLSDTWRWVLTAAAAVGAFFAALYVNLFVLVFGHFPRDLSEAIAGFLLGALVSLAGSVTAPRYRFATGLVLSFVGAALGALIASIHFVAALTGGLVTSTFVAWWFRPSRTKRTSLRVGIVAGAVLLGLVGFLYARYVDYPTDPDDLPPELVFALDTDASRILAFYRYDLGGFIDHEWLWRIDAEPDAVSVAVRGLELQRSEAVPEQFWRMPPHYWPRAMPMGGAAYRSPGFTARGRGSDGEHYFLVHDKARARAFVWVKSNF